MFTGFQFPGYVRPGGRRIRHARRAQRATARAVAPRAIRIPPLTDSSLHDHLQTSDRRASASVFPRSPQGRRSTSSTSLPGLRAEGHAISAVTTNAGDLVVVNTCGFIDAGPSRSTRSARRSPRTARSSSPPGAKGRGDPRRASGGAVDHRPARHRQVMDAVHAPPAAARPVHRPAPPDYGLRLTPQHYAYLRISEGCNHRCSFCIIPDAATSSAGESTGVKEPGRSRRRRRQRNCW